MNVKIGDSCDRCMAGKVVFKETPNSIHYGKLICNMCDKFFIWLKNPDNDGKRTQTSKYEIKQVRDFNGYDKYFCFFCLREKEQLGFNETLTIDHIEELSKGGKDELKNLQILCSYCHKLKNLTRTYINWHFKNGR